MATLLWLCRQNSMVNDHREWHGGGATDGFIVQHISRKYINKAIAVDYQSHTKEFASKLQR